ncbi:MAG: polymer-forming cytoskeletal protein [Rhodospirillaceae bacterium]|jgi:cytoskeletal protein CcmA (bactofilin family)|nr:polymer-forming cytoskeletal protein [Rhodospirillaceae bacterium]
MFSKTNRKSGGDAGSGTPRKPAVPSIISADLRIVGDLNSAGEIHIDGCVDGDIKSKILMVGESAVIKGEIIAETISVHGTINGQINAQTVNLAKTAHVAGDILHKNLSIETGAFLEGHCKRMDDKKDSAEGRINLVVKDSTSPAPVVQSKVGGEGKKVAAGN